MLEMTALHWAAEHNHWDVAELLVRHKGDVHATSMSDTSPFDSALDRSNLETLMILQVALSSAVFAVAVTVSSSFVLTAGEVFSLAGLISAGSGVGCRGDSPLVLGLF
uniref:Uncharacterized protein n=1 Tax=Coturnix japonica TaxID=93934 RepID=A0A8C2TWA3_COTJA